MPRTMLLLPLWVAAWSLSGPVEASADAKGPLTRTRELMHTRVTVALAQPLPAARSEAAFAEVFGIFEEIEATMNEWRPDSPLGRINAEAGGRAVPAPPAVCEVIRRSLVGAERTGGLFDPTWAALRGVWRFGGKGPRVPAAEAVKEACGRIDWRQVEVTDDPRGVPGSCRVRLRRAGMQLGLGGVAKGFGIDLAVAALRRQGISHFFVQAGGDLYLGGRNGERPWRVGIRDPRGPPERTFARIELSDAAFSTSGDYERFFIVDGVRHHHVIDPRTCWPAKASRSVTVLAQSATDAEFLTKAIFILGPAEGLALAKRFGARAVLVDADNEVHLSPGLEGKLEHWAPTP